MKHSRCAPARQDDAPSLADFQWVVSMIRTLRPDLCKLFNSKGQISLELARWLVSSGTKEYRSLMESRGLRHILSQPLKSLGLTPLQALIYLERKDVQQAFPLSLRKTEFLQWFYRHGVDEHALHPWLSETDWTRYAALNPNAAPPPAPERAEASPPFGVNLVGYAFGQLGIGEDARMTARALRAAGVPFVMLNFPPGDDIPQNDRSMEAHVRDEGPYSVNIFCMTALETARYYSERGARQFRGRYNIGYWPWELSRWPEDWRAATELVDEVWVSSRHTYDALAPVSPVPVLIMPLAVELGEVGPQTRADFGLPDDAYLFCFSFDLNSSIHRKNPEACLRAFQEAFPPGEPTPRPVGLVIKTHRPAGDAPQWEALKQAAAGDARIRIIEETLSRPELLALYGNCDCFLSLHRAEGFGRGIAEALLLGLRVIATGYSGNVDFCRDAPQAELVDYRLIPVNEGEYPFGEGQVWAEAEQDDVVRRMRRCLELPPPAPRDFFFSCESMGRRYRNRLETLRAEAAAPRGEVGG